MGSPLAPIHLVFAFHESPLFPHVCSLSFHDPIPHPDDHGLALVVFWTDPKHRNFDIVRGTFDRQEIDDGCHSMPADDVDRHL